MLLLGFYYHKEAKLESCALLVLEVLYNTSLI